MSGAGLGVLYQDMVSEELKSGSLTNLTPAGFDLDGHSHLVLVKDRSLAPIATQFLEFARGRRVSIGEESERAAMRNSGSRRGRRNKDSGQPINLRESGLMAT
ncbi:MAG: hypothetical protein EXR70_03760 [Deltaproteobacteria bacterium]|nr:hypothetical protein [Deltaproteobacteria bacterium]